MYYSEGISHKNLANVGQFEEVSLLYEPKAEIQKQFSCAETEKFPENVRCKLAIITGLYLTSVISSAGVGAGLWIGNGGDASLLVAGKVCVGLSAGILVVAPVCFFVYVFCKVSKSTE